jgi:hypothetical protein
MQNLSLLTEKAEQILNSKFVGIKKYVSSTSGEISDRVILVGINPDRARKDDIKLLQNYTPTELTLKNDLGKVFVLTALEVEAIRNSMIESLIKNMDSETASNQSIAQKNTYTFLNKVIKQHNETGAFYIYGITQRKTIHVEGVYKPVNSRKETLVKNYLTYSLKLTAGKYRNFKVSNLETVNILGSSIEF